MSWRRRIEYLTDFERADVPARVLGGVAIALHEHTPLPDSLRRPYADIDVVVAGGREGDCRAPPRGTGL